jgi:Domain of unknown function (DUF397)
MNDLLCTSEATTPVAASSWTKSSLSHADGNCVEVADLLDGQVGMRHSKHVGGLLLRFPPEEWRAFLGGIRNGDFDILAA